MQVHIHIVSFFLAGGTYVGAYAHRKFFLAGGAYAGAYAPKSGSIW